MIYTILSKLFKQDDFAGEYKPKPTHLFIALLIMGGGVTTLSYGNEWAWFGGLTLLLGFLLGITILLCLNWDKINEYWSLINEHVTLMNKSNSPELWEALGYTKPVKKVEVIEKVDDNHWKLSQLPISPAKMNMIANKVLGSQSLEFTEEQYGKLIPNFRQFRKDWIAQGKLVQKNKKNKKLGYVLSRKGLQVMYEFASENMKLNGE